MRHFLQRFSRNRGDDDDEGIEDPGALPADSQDNSPPTISIKVASSSPPVQRNRAASLVEKGANFLRKKSEEPNNNHNIDAVLVLEDLENMALDDVVADSRRLYSLFDYMTYCSCAESLGCYLLCLELEDPTLDFMLCKNFCHYIVDTYLADTASQPVNLLARTRMGCLEMYNAWQSEAGEQQLSPRTPPPREAFRPIAQELQRLITSDVLKRYGSSKQARLLCDLSVFLSKHPVPVARLLRMSTESNSWKMIEGKMPAVRMFVQKKGRYALGVITLRESATRVQKHLADLIKYPDWAPDVESVEEVQNFGSYLGVYRLKLALDGGRGPSFFVNLGVSADGLRTHVRSIYSWQTYGSRRFPRSAATSGDLPEAELGEKALHHMELEDPSGFVLESAGAISRVAFSLKCRKTRVPNLAQILVENTLMGVLLALGGSVESQEIEDESLAFLKRLV